MSRLGFKLLIIFLIISLGGLILTSFFINRSINSSFQVYLSQKRQDADQLLVELIEELYQEGGSWKAIIPELLRLDVFARRYIRIEDRQGQVIYNSNSINRRMPGSIMMHGMMRWQQRRRQFEPGSTIDYTLKVDNQAIGKVFFDIPGQQGLLNQRDRYFRKRINRGILQAAGLIALITVLLSYYFSRRLSNPLVEMSKATQLIADGKFKQRVNISGDDELGKLGMAFNDMAAKLEHLEKIRREGTSDLAHELRTPLATMRSYLEAMEDGVIAADQKNIASLHSELMRLVRLVDRLGELAEVEGKIINLKKEELDLNQLLKEVTDRFRPLAEEKDICFDLESRANNLMIYGEKDSLEQIFSNLLSNAIKYTDQGGITVSLTRSGPDAEIKIKDTGVGISKEDLPYVFERFFRADKSRSLESGGTGIGLTITRELVEAHLGKIEVRSRPGQGTEFIVYLPLV